MHCGQMVGSDDKADTPSTRSVVCKAGVFIFDGIRGAFRCRIVAFFRMGNPAIRFRRSAAYTVAGGEALFIGPLQIAEFFVHGFIGR